MFLPVVFRGSVGGTEPGQPGAVLLQSSCVFGHRRLSGGWPQQALLLVQGPLVLARRAEAQARVLAEAVAGEQLVEPAGPRDERHRAAALPEVVPLVPLVVVLPEEVRLGYPPPMGLHRRLPGIPQIRHPPLLGLRHAGEGAR